MVRVRNHGDRAAQRQRRYIRLAALKAEYASGKYVAGSFHKETRCEGCGRTFPIWRDGAMRYCSRACAGLDIGSEIARERKAVRQRNYKAVVRKHFQHREQKVCPSCQQLFLTALSRQTYCSSACWVKSRRVDKAPRSCPQCACMFTPFPGRKPRTFCSAACRLKYFRIAHGKSHRHRARRYGVPYEPVNRLKVFERDRWTCQICGAKTPRKLMGTIDKRAPELDHRIPMAPPHSGGHTYVNCQCACRDCNIRKGSRLILGQMQLFCAP